MILYDAQDGKMGSHGQDPRSPGDSPIVGIARLADPSDRYLQTWTRADDNPVNFTGPPIAFPGPVWQNGAHWNFVGQGARFESADASFHAWTNKGAFVPDGGETSGQWWAPVPNQIDGSPPPPGSPNRAVNVGNGAQFLLGTYDAANETFTPWSPAGEVPGREARLEGGSASWWGATGGSDAAGRMLLIGWATPDYTNRSGPGIYFLTRLTALREVNWDAEIGNLVANPVPELAALHAGEIAQETGVPLSAAPHLVPGTAGGAAASADVNVSFSGFSLNGTASFGACVLSNGSLGSGLGIFFSSGGSDPADYFLPGVDLPGGDYNVTNVNYADPHICQVRAGGRACVRGGPWGGTCAPPPQASCTADPRCAAYTYVTRPPLVGSCCLKGSVPAQNPNPTCTSGIKPAPPGSFDVRVGSCAEAAAGALRGPPVGTLRLRGGSAAPTLTLRVLADRSVADFFAEGGRWAGTVSWPTSHAPRNPGDSAVLAWATTPGVVADIDVAAMGCGWVTPSYTDSPTM